MLCVKWTKPSGVENHSLSIRLLHVAETIRLRLCIKFVRDDRTLENERPCHSKLFQKFCFIIILVVALSPFVVETIIR
jgi:hypothetical protein